MNKIGYACMTMNVANTNIRHCLKKTCSNQNLLEVAEHNLNSLYTMLLYNEREGIHLFRISSDIIPFASHETIYFPWRERFAEQLAVIGEKAKQSKIRLSMHPGQYTVLNSPHEKVVQAAIRDLDYHCQFLDALNMPDECKIILHIGGAYQDRNAAIESFKENYKKLSQKIKNRLIIENDDRIFTIQETLEIGQELEVPVVFDILHHEINPSVEVHSNYEWIALCAQTWKQRDGQQKIHYSQQADGKRAGSHSNTIDVEKFCRFYRGLSTNIDIMLEVKDKNWSAKKCIIATNATGSTRLLEEEWAHYKYAVLEKNIKEYQAIRQLLKDKQAYPVEEFYTYIDQALIQPQKMGVAVNAFQHVWGYFKQDATNDEKKRFQRLLERYQEDKVRRPTVKAYIWKLVEKYQQSYLKQSYYFFVDGLYK